MKEIQNPILRGFHPDPSIVRVGRDYYIATSTFEWWPGVRIHHSRDLIHWRLIGYPLTRISQLDLRGVGPSQGIWAPCLTWNDGTFYLVYTVVKAFYCNMYDTENYLVTAQDIRGPWSDPIALNNFGFDPSLFHDDDGRKYMVSMVTDHRVPKKYAGRLVLQEYDPKAQRMVGPVRDIYRADRIFLEGPHIFKKDGWYYLFSADTGTGEGHGQTIQRSQNVWGPYEMYRPADPLRQDGEAYSILTSRHHEDILLQKAGHCDLVETPEGNGMPFICAAVPASAEILWMPHVLPDAAVTCSAGKPPSRKCAGRRTAGWSWMRTACRKAGQRPSAIPLWNGCLHRRVPQMTHRKRAAVRTSPGLSEKLLFTGMILILPLWPWIISPCAFPWTAIISPSPSVPAGFVCMGEADCPRDFPRRSSPDG